MSSIFLISEMDKLQSMYFLTIAAYALLSMTTTLAMPYGIDNYDPDITAALYSDVCQFCFDYADDSACNICLASLPTDPVYVKRSGSNTYYHPFFRGGYPKKSSYNPYYNPMFRGSFLKKSAYRVQQQSIYHPFLRGGYSGRLAGRLNRDTSTDDDL